MMPYSKVKKIAKELCDKSGCHHKCKEIDECVVMEDAEEMLENLPSVLTNEDKVSVKGKYIEEMANDLYENRPYRELWLEDAQDIAEVLYNAGYRKQSEGEWKKPSRYSEPICTICKKSPCQYFGMLPPFCPNCGAKMKGGE